MSENLYCPGQKTYTEEGRENFDRIFNKQSMKYCRICSGELGNLTYDDWNIYWDKICDDCWKAENSARREKWKT